MATSRQGSPLAEEIGADYELLRPAYEEFGESLRVLVRGILSVAEIPFDQVTARAKTTASVIKKVENREYKSLGDLTDKCGVRVITRYQSDIDRACEQIAAEFDVDEVVEHGSETPEAFGYASKHLLIRLKAPRNKLPEWQKYHEFVAEVQVRSILQHAWASISHSLDYKLEADVPAPVRRRLYRVAALLETGDELFDTFRSEVESLRREYEGEAASENWTDLPLNLDSLRAVWSRLNLGTVAATAVAAGWEEAEAVWFLVSFNTTELSRMLAIARQAGFRRVGDLREIVESLQRDELVAIRKACQVSSDFVPAAVPVDVLALAIANRSRDAMKGLSLEAPFKDILWKAVTDPRPGAEADGDRDDDRQS